MRDNHPVYASIRALDDLLDSLPAVGPSRLRQLRAFRGELARALVDDGFRPARHSLTALLDTPVLQRYFEVAETGTLRDRLVGGAKPPTSLATNQARRDCVDILLSAAGRPRLQPATRPWNREPDTRPAVTLRPTPTSAELAELRRRLAHALNTRLDPGQARFTAMLAVVLDTAARAGELAAMRLDDLDEDLTTVEVRRSPQHGTAPVRPARTDLLPLSALTAAALRQWLPAREHLTAPLQGAATALWVSLRSNHTGRRDDQGRATMRPPGLPLQDRGLARTYAAGRHRYALGHLLPPKMEQLRRALTTSLHLP
jgi:integrase